MAMAQIFVGLMTEGTTDDRFLDSIVERTLKKIALEECSGEIDIYFYILEKNKGSFKEQVLEVSKQGIENFGMTMLFVHVDADNATSDNVYKTRIEPVKEALGEQDESEYCKVLVALVPVQEMEAWMLADKELLKSEIVTDKSDNELKINRSPESIANPKEVIEDAIRIARAGITKRRRREVSISDLYRPVGQHLALEKLEKLNSYQDFKNNVREAFKELGYLH